MSEFADYQMDRSRNVYRHNAKPEWGSAVIAWEREGKRGYRFEDGQLRVFASAHYHLLDVIDVSRDRVRSLLTLLDRAEEVASGRPPKRDAAPTLSEQVDHFLRAYPGGFSGELWVAERRRRDDGRALRRHRDPAIKMAQTELTQQRLTGFLEGQRELDGVRALSDVLASTDLVVATHLRPLVGMSAHWCRILVSSLRELLYGEGPPAIRLAGWIKVLTSGIGRAPVWPLATAPLALVWPQQHVCVQRSSFATQATIMAPQLRISQAPNASQYPRLLSMAERVRECLTEAGCPPVDLFDVADFMGQPAGVSTAPTA